MSSHQEAVQGQISQELADQQAALVQEAEHALFMERMKHSNLHSEYVMQLTSCQEHAEVGLQQANSAICELQHSLQAKEQAQTTLQEKLNSMQRAMDNQKRL